ncbi:hypothetical protein JYU34_010527 [Plutella xylostella]|uniref:Uncharacterized protein n=1 Tax=Plutella xylostella TaxID=51655 RepID=A0ABQ7QIQ4_PLUXY|nr:hypothetical protein JYU34_010527 [Plutella xylostella]
MPTVKEEICSYSSKYQDRLQGHTNKLARDLLMSDPEDTRRLKRWHILSLSDRILSGDKLELEIKEMMFTGPSPKTTRDNEHTI